MSDIVCNFVGNNVQPYRNEEIAGLVEGTELVGEAKSNGKTNGEFSTSKIQDYMSIY